MVIRTLPTTCLVLILPLLTACGAAGGGADGASVAELYHQPIAIVDPALYGSTQASGTVAAQGLITVGSVYLEAQIPAESIAGVQMQATDVAVNGADGYVTYSTYDTGGVVMKMGAVQHFTSASCDNPLTPRTEYCLNAAATFTFPTADIFAAFVDATGLWVAGSTLDETYIPKFARLYKMNLSAGGDPTSIAVTQALDSYAGTGITRVGTNLLVTTGTSTNAGQMGGVYLVNAGTLAQVATQPLYDARAVALDPLDATKAFVVRGAIDGTHPGAVEAYPSDLSTTPTREIATGGNNVAQSKSMVLAGKSLLLTSAGDQGFRVSCKATGASLATVPAPIVSGIPAALTVTNSVAALPGYILAANGEAGVYVYSFQKSSTLYTSYCQGVTVALLGRLSLGATNSYVNGELSANGVKYVPIFDPLHAGVVSAKLVIIASGNKGISLINMSQLNVSLNDVDDF